MESETAWEKEAENWIRWARTPGHDAYWYFADSFFEHVVGDPGRATLEIGCGEGRGARDLARRGHRVVAIDSSPTLVRAARDADTAGYYVLTDVASLPFREACFDLVVAYNSLMDVEDMAAAVREAARVLEPGGRLCISVTHPLNDAGCFSDTDPDAAFTIDGSYFGRRPFDETFERDGLTMTFHGSCYPLEAYTRALEDAGLVIEKLREPKPEERATRDDPAYRRWERIPMFLQIRAAKR